MTGKSWTFYILLGTVLSNSYMWGHEFLITLWGCVSATRQTGAECVWFGQGGRWDVYRTLDSESDKKFKGFTREMQSGEAAEELRQERVPGGWPSVSWGWDFSNKMGMWVTRLYLVPCHGGKKWWQVLLTLTPEWASEGWKSTSCPRWQRGQKKRGRGAVESGTRCCENRGASCPLQRQLATVRASSEFLCN